MIFCTFLLSLSAKKIRKLEPINVIRGIDPLKPAGKNHFPLNTARGTVGINLILKQTFESAGRNILLFAVTFVLMILLTFTQVHFFLM